MDLQTLLNTPGLPGWLITIFLFLIFLKQMGVLDYFFAHLKSKGQQEHEQAEFERAQAEARNAAEQNEQIALWSQMTQLQTMTLHQNELLLEFVINTSTDWHKAHADRLEEVTRNMQQIFVELKSLVTRINDNGKKDTK